MKFGLFVVFLAVVGCVFAQDDDEECCSAEDRREIQYIWHHVWGSAFTDRKVAIARAVFDDLFAHYPSARALFERVKVDEPESGEFRAHLVRVANGLDNIINLFSEPLVLEQQLEHLAGQHEARKGVTKQFFHGIGQSFARILPQVTSCFNTEAWEKCFHLIEDRVAHDLP